jgi:signal transduction histidine kinase
MSLDKQNSPVSGHKGIGLISMAERAQLYGGHLDILTAPNTGVTVLVKWPAKK